jgi:hypothetical protein
MVDSIGFWTKETSTVNKGRTPPTGPLSFPERRGILIVLGVVAAIIVAATTWVVTSRPSTYDQSRDGCVNVAAASSMGGVISHQCGDAARTWCQANYALHDTHAEAVQAQCRLAGILP